MSFEFGVNGQRPGDLQARANAVFAFGNAPTVGGRTSSTSTGEGPTAPASESSQQHARRLAALEAIDPVAVTAAAPSSPRENEYSGTFPTCNTCERAFGEEEDDWVNMRDPDHGYTALHYVVKMGPENTDPNPEKVLYLLLLTSIYMMFILDMNRYTSCFMLCCNVLAVLY